MTTQAADASHVLEAVTANSSEVATKNISITTRVKQLGKIILPYKQSVEEGSLIGEPLDLITDRAIFIPFIQTIEAGFNDEVTNGENATAEFIKSLAAIFQQKDNGREDQKTYTKQALKTTGVMLRHLTPKANAPEEGQPIPQGMFTYIVRLLKEEFDEDVADLMNEMPTSMATGAHSKHLQALQVMAANELLKMTAELSQRVGNKNPVVRVLKTIRKLKDL